MDALYEPDRITRVTRLMQQYSPLLYTGVRLRRGIEGDPCNTYRSAAESPCGTITELEREGDVVRFTLKMDGSGELVKMSNTNVYGREVWEPAPGETFADLATNTDPVASLYGRAAAEIKTLQDDLQKEQQLNSEFRASMGQVVQHLVSDLLLTYRGKEPVFAGQYADRHDRFGTPGTDALPRMLSGDQIVPL